VVEITGINHSNVSRILRRDRPGDVPLSSIDVIAEHLDLDPYELLGMIHRGKLPSTVDPLSLH